MDDSLTPILLQLQQFSAAKLKEVQTPCLRRAVSSPLAPLTARPTRPKPEVAKVIAERAKIAKQIIVRSGRIPALPPCLMTRWHWAVHVQHVE
jgi:hypothetical protein